MTRRNGADDTLRRETLGDPQAVLRLLAIVRGEMPGGASLPARPEGGAAAEETPRVSRLPRVAMLHLQRTPRAIRELRDEGIIAP